MLPSSICSSQHSGPRVARRCTRSMPHSAPVTHQQQPPSSIASHNNGLRLLGVMQWPTPPCCAGWQLRKRTNCRNSLSHMRPRNVPSNAQCSRRCCPHRKTPDRSCGVRAGDNVQSSQSCFKVVRTLGQGTATQARTRLSYRRSVPGIDAMSCVAADTTATVERNHLAAWDFGCL